MHKNSNLAILSRTNISVLLGGKDMFEQDLWKSVSQVIVLKCVALFRLNLSIWKQTLLWDGPLQRPPYLVHYIDTPGNDVAYFSLMIQSQSHSHGVGTGRSRKRHHKNIWEPQIFHKLHEVGKLLFYCKCPSLITAVMLMQPERKPTIPLSDGEKAGGFVSSCPRNILDFKLE